MSDGFKVSQETKDKIAAFQEADKKYKEQLDAFERAHELELVSLDKVRDDRNAKLDEAKRSLRAELETTDAGITRLTFNEGPFKVQKKWSDFYIPEKLVGMLADKGLYDAALSAGIVAVKVETAKFEEVKQFLEKHGVAKDFECCEDGAPAPNAIGGPKQVPPFGAELKKE